MVSCQGLFDEDAGKVTFEAAVVPWFCNFVTRDLPIDTV